MSTGDINTRHDGEEPQAPHKLVAALKEPPARRVFVPPAIDAAILKAARQHLGGAPARTRGVLGVLRSWVLRPAFATVCVALLGLIYFLGRTGTSTAARQDLNRDGQVDILDAFQLARELRDDKKPAASDANADGTVDRRDVEAIAVHAVKLEKGGKS